MFRPLKKPRWLDVLFLALTVTGAFFAWQAEQKRSRLQAEYARLLPITGDLAIDDPAKVYIRAIETGEPLSFAWRVYLPANYPLFVNYSHGGWSSSTTSDPAEFIARVRFRMDDDGQMHVYTRFHGGSGRMNFGDAQLSRLLRDRFAEVQVEQLGSEGLVKLEVNQPAVLLRLSLPPSLEQEARERLSPYAQQQYLPVLYELSLGKTNKP